MKGVVITFAALPRQRCDARKATFHKKPNGINGCTVATWVMAAMANETEIPLFGGHNALLGLSNTGFESDKEQWNGVAISHNERVNKQQLRSHGAMK